MIPDEIFIGRIVTVTGNTYYADAVTLEDDFVLAQVDGEPRLYPYSAIVYIGFATEDTPDA